MPLSAVMQNDGGNGIMSNVAMETGYWKQGDGTSSSCWKCALVLCQKIHKVKRGGGRCCFERWNAGTWCCSPTALRPRRLCGTVQNPDLCKHCNLPCTVQLPWPWYLLSIPSVPQQVLQALSGSTPEHWFYCHLLVVRAVVCRLRLLFIRSSLYFANVRWKHRFNTVTLTYTKA